MQDLCKLAADGTTAPVLAIGDLELGNHHGNQVTLKDVLYVPSLSLLCLTNVSCCV